MAFQGAATPLLAAGNTALHGGHGSHGSAASAGASAASIGPVMALPPPALDPAPEYQPFRVPAPPSRDAAAQALLDRAVARHRSSGRSAAVDGAGASAGLGDARESVSHTLPRGHGHTGMVGRPAFAATPTPALAAAVLGAALHPHGSSSSAALGVGAGALAAAAASPALTSASLHGRSGGAGSGSRGRMSSAASVVSSGGRSHASRGRAHGAIGTLPPQLSEQAKRIVAHMAAEHRDSSRGGLGGRSPSLAVAAAMRGGGGFSSAAASSSAAGPGAAAGPTPASRVITDALLGAGAGAGATGRLGRF